MLMRGDMQKLIDHINPVFDNAFAKIEALEKQLEELNARLDALEGVKSTTKASKSGTKVEKAAA